MKKIIFMPTWRCNLQCAYCDYRLQKCDGDDYILNAFGKDLAIKKELTPEQWIKHLAKFDPFVLEMTGGEPTMYKGLPEVLNGLPFDSEWAMTSNTLLTDVINELPGHNCKDWTASYHFHNDDIFLNNIKTLRAKGIPVRITIVLTPDNLDILREKVRDFVFQNIGVNIHPMLKQGFDWKDHREVWDAAIEFAALSPCVNIIKDISDAWVPERHEICPAGTDKYFVVMPDGSVVRCYSDILRYEPTENIETFVPAKENGPCGKECMFPCDKQIARKTK